MCRVILFGGTEEGREIAELLADKGVPSLVCVATEYGAAALPKGLKILQKRLERAERAFRFVLTRRIRMPTRRAKTYRRRAGTAERNMFGC